MGALNWNKEITQHNQRLFMEQKSEQNTLNALNDAKGLVHGGLERFTLNQSVDAMEKKMLNDTYVIGKLAIFGQATVIYAKPNTGKTLLILYLLAQAIKNKQIKGEHVYYINADDAYKGLVEKIKFANTNGFKMLAPGHEGFKADMLLTILIAMNEQDTSRGTIIILDTLKKFTDPMDKKSSSAFTKVIREFISHGGSVILLAHTNKHRDGGGKVVFSGTSDIVDDVDCAYTLDVTNKTDCEVSVLFENFKCRGDVAPQAGYSYSKWEGQTYLELIATVNGLEEQDNTTANRNRIMTELLDKNDRLIKAIIETIMNGYTLKTTIVKAVGVATGIGRRRVIDVIDTHTGCYYVDGHRWDESNIDKNSKTYKVLPVVETDSLSKLAYLKATLLGDVDQIDDVF